MNRFNIIDESREALIDQLYLIYIYLTDAAGRVRTIGDSFDIENIYEEPMDIDALKKALKEFEALCSEFPKYQAWNDFPQDARSGHKLFGGKFLTRTEWFLLQDFLRYESIPHIHVRLSPKQRGKLGYNLAHSISLKMSHALLHIISPGRHI